MDIELKDLQGTVYLKTIVRPRPNPQNHHPYVPLEGAVAVGGSVPSGGSMYGLFWVREQANQRYSE